MGGVAGAAAIIGAGASVYGLYSGAQAAKKEADYNKQVGRNNQKLAKEQAKDIVTRGLVAEETLVQDAIRFADDQLLGFAAGGVDVTSGVAQKATDDTARTTAADVVALQHNVKRDVWATEVGAVSSASQTQLENIRARNAEKAANIQIITTLLRTAGRFA